METVADAGRFCAEDARRSDSCVSREFVVLILVPSNILSLQKAGLHYSQLYISIDGRLAIIKGNQGKGEPKVLRGREGVYLWSPSRPTLYS